MKLMMLIESKISFEDDVPNEVLYNILEPLQDNKGLMFKCLTVSKRWHRIAVRLLWYELEFWLRQESGPEAMKKLVGKHIPDETTEGSLDPFTMVRRLSLYVELNNFTSIADYSLQMLETLELFVCLLKACPKLNFLRLRILPIPHDDRWGGLIKQWNTAIDELVQLAASKPTPSELILDIAQLKYQWNPFVRGTLAPYVEKLNKKITRLHLCEDAKDIVPWFGWFTGLRRLDITNTGFNGASGLSAFWDAIEQLQLDELNLGGLEFPRSREFKNWKSLQAIRLNEFLDVEGACYKILSSFPNLRAVAFSHPSMQKTDKSQYTPLPLTDLTVACTNLRSFTFTHCKTQPELLAIVAKSCPHIQMCAPPDNASDNDLITLIDNCHFLTTLLIDGCTDLTGLSIHYIPRAERLRSLLFKFEQLVYLDEECIFALAEKCPDLHSRGFRASAMDPKNEKMQRSMVREWLQGTATFKRWFLRFMEWQQEGPYLQRVHFNIDAIREDMADYVLV